jgi:hypothetical protein
VQQHVDADERERDGGEHLRRDARVRLKPKSRF